MKFMCSVISRECRFSSQANSNKLNFDCKRLRKTQPIHQFQTNILILNTPLSLKPTTDSQSLKRTTTPTALMFSCSSLYHFLSLKLTSTQPRVHSRPINARSCVVLTPRWYFVKVAPAKAQQIAITKESEN